MYFDIIQTENRTPNDMMSIANCYQLKSAIDNNQTHRKQYLLIAIDWQKLITIDNSCLQVHELLSIEKTMTITT